MTLRIAASPQPAASAAKQAPRNDGRRKVGFSRNKAFSLFEVMVAVAILSTALVFVFRSFSTVLTAAKLSRNLTLACWLAEGKMWEAGVEAKGAASALNLNSKEVIQGVEFSSAVSVELSEINSVPLKLLKCDVSWLAGWNKKDNFTLSTYLAPAE